MGGEEGLVGWRSEGQGYAQGEQAVGTPARQLQTQRPGPLSLAGVAGDAWQSKGERGPQRTQCLSGLASATSLPPRSTSPPSAMSSTSPSVSHPLPLPPPPLSPASCLGLWCPRQWSPGLWCCAPELWP